MFLFFCITAFISGVEFRTVDSNSFYVIIMQFRRTIHLFGKFRRTVLRRTVLSRTVHRRTVLRRSVQSPYWTIDYWLIRIGHGISKYSLVCFPFLSSRDLKFHMT